MGDDADNGAAGVLLPGVDPMIGEIVIATVKGNPQAHPAQIILGLVQTAPTPEVAAELVSAALELLLCREKGHLYWLELTGQAILIGSRRARSRDALHFGHAVWPIGCLMTASPQSVTIDTGHGRKRVWLCAEPLEGIAIRQSEAIALGNAMVEAFGGRIIEDRTGPEVMQHAFQEQRLTKRAQLRASALAGVERLTLESRVAARPDHARAAMAEAFPGSCSEGLRICPDGDLTRVYLVEKRLNESWVSIVAVLPGGQENVEPCAWVREDGQPPINDAPKDCPLHVGFTDAPALASQGEA